MNTLLVNLAGLLLMAAIVWWFWLYRRAPVAQSASGVIEVRVADGVYSPDCIRVPVNQPTRLRFLRQDPSSCAATVIFEGLDTSAELPLGEVKEITITPTTPGQYSFSCPMQMYRGTLEVQDV